MTVQDQTALLVRANQVRTEVGGFANTASRIGGLFRDIIDSLFGTQSRFSVKAYGAVGDGSTAAATEAAGFAAAAAAAALVGGTVYVPKGTYGDGSDWAFALPSGVTLDGDGDASVLKNCAITCTGTAGAEIAFTGAAAKGATSIPIPATGLTDSWLRVIGVINCQSADAGADQLGHDPAQESYFAEFVRVQTGGAASATLYGPLIFPYSNTPGSDTDPAFTTSVARAVTFHQGARIRRIKMLGKSSGAFTNIYARFCRDLVLEEVTVDTNDLTSQIVRFEYCLDSHVKGGSLTGRRNTVPAGSTANPIIIASCQGCTIENASLFHGNQGVDITYFDNDTTYRGGPSIACGAVNCRSYYAVTDGFTTHEGCWKGFIDNCTTFHAVNGARIRSRGDRVTGCRFISGAGTGNGVKINAGATINSTVSGNEIDGYLQGVEVTYETTADGYAALAATLGMCRVDISKNHIANSADHAVYLNTAPTSATMVGAHVVDNDIINTTNDPIAINSYNNGAFVDGNRIHGVAAAKGGIQWGANIKRLWIGSNHIYGVNAAGFDLRGFSVASFMTDAATFPSGESEALLWIAPQFTDALGSTGILRVSAAYRQAHVLGWQPNANGVGAAAPTLERSSLGWYLSGTEVLGRSLDTAGTTTRTYVLTFSGSADPTAGAGVPAAMPAFYVRSTNGVLYSKTGAGDTAWTVVGTQT